MHCARISCSRNDSKAVLHNLEEFTVESHDSEGVCHVLKSAPRLRKLTFSKCMYFRKETKAEMLECCEELKDLSFKRCCVGADFLEDILLTCSSLESLHLHGCNMSVASEKTLKEIADTVQNKPQISCHDSFDFFERI